MADAPVFTQIQAASPLYALTPAAQAGWAGFWSPETAGSAGSLSLEQAWATVHGVYVFIGKKPADPAVLAAGLTRLVPWLLAMGPARVVWIENSEGPPAHWQTQTLQARQGGDGSWVTTRSLQTFLGGYGLLLPSGATLTQRLPASGGVCGFDLNGPGITFLAPAGTFAATQGTCRMALGGAGVGAITAQLPMPATEGADVFFQLGVGLRYAYPSRKGRPGSVDLLHMPVISQGGAAFTLLLSLFPGVPLDPALSSLSFFIPQTSGGAAPTFPCALRTVLGYATKLTPLAAQAALPAARLVFNASPRWAPVAGRALPGPFDCHLCPDGAFRLGTDTPAGLRSTVSGGLKEKVMLGASGTEYVALTEGNDCVALFTGGAPAYAPSLTPKSDGKASSELLTSDATTAAATFLPPIGTAGGLTYFAQPRQSPLFRGSTSQFLDFQEVPAATLSAAARLPLGIYSGIDDGQIEAARLLEKAVLAPTRNAIAMQNPGGARSLAGQDSPATCVTPQGLCVTLSPDMAAFETLTLARMPDMTPPDRMFTVVGKDLQAALQADQLFFVVADPKVLSPADPNDESTSVAYRLDAKALDILAGEGVDAATIAALRQHLGALGYPTYANKKLFTAALATFAPNVTAEDSRRLCAIAGQLSLTIDHWQFQLSPDSWRTDEERPTLLLVKYAEASLEELVADPNRWGFPGASGDAAQTRKRIQDIFEAARQSHESGKASPYADFYTEVASNPAWNGFLFLNAPVAMAELPSELLFLTAGIDTSRFYSHHLAIGATPYSSQTGELTLGQTSVSGLIDYNDASDLVLESNIPFAFKTLQVTAVFKNTALADFAASAELMINRLFGTEATKIEATHGNNLVLAGGLQRQNGEPVYAFALQGKNDFSLMRSALTSVRVGAVQLQTAAQNNAVVKVGFQLSGEMRFVELPLFDLFSYGAPLSDSDAPADAESALAFSGLGIVMTFNLGDPGKQTFEAALDRIAFDPANSAARLAGLVSRFPVKIAGFAQGGASASDPDTAASSPEDKGYTAVNAPFDAALMAAPWYGLVFNLNLGTLGALSGGKPIMLSLLAAWCPGRSENEQPVYLGLKMPDARPLGIDWPLQGVLHLGFRNMDFVASGDRDKRAYMLRLRRFGLSALGMHFPPGNLDILLFGDPSGGHTDELGWYAVYAPDSKSKAAPEPRLLEGVLNSPAPTSPTRPQRRRRNGRRGILPNTGL